METTGTVQAVSIKKKGYAIKIGQNWYNSFGECNIKKGDKVKITYSVKGDFKNIDEIETTDKTEEEFTNAEDYQKQRQLEILKGQCFNKGIDIYLATKPVQVSLEKAVLVAKELYKKAIEKGYFEW